MKILNGLKPNFRTIDEQFKEQGIVYRKNKSFYKFIERIFPYGIEGNYSFDDLGSTCIRCFINLNKNENATLRIIKWLTELKDKRLIVEKFWRKEQGCFAYRIERKYGYIDYIIFIEETANIDGCKITKRKKMHTIYETDCENESTILIK